MGCDLPIAAEARRHIQTLPIILGILLHLTGKCRARTHDAHIALQDVPQLRQLIDAGLADKLTHTSDPRVFLDLEHRAIHLILVQQIIQFRLRIRTHRTELVEFKGLAAAADTDLAEDRSCRGVIDHNSNGGNQHHRRQHHQGKQGKDHILGPTTDPVPLMIFQIFFSVDFQRFCALNCFHFSILSLPRSHGVAMHLYAFGLLL